MDKTKKIFGLSANVFLLGMVSLLNDISSEMILPLLPLFIVSLGGGAIVIGLIGGFADSLTSIFKVFFGHLSDRKGVRKPFVWAGYSLSMLSKLLYAFSFSWVHVFFLRITERLGKGLRTAPRDALIAAAAFEKKRGKAFGIHRAMDTSGAVIGSVIALLLFAFFIRDFRFIFLIAALIAFSALIPLKFVREKEAGKRVSSFRFAFRQLPRNLKLFLAVATLFSLGNFTYMFFILKTQTAFGFDPTQSIVMVLALYVLFNIVYALLSIPAGMLSDRIGRKKVLVSGYALFGLVSLGFAFTEFLAGFIVLFVLYGLFYALIEGNQRAFAADLVDEKVRGTALGGFHTLVGLAALPASVIAGTLWEFVSPESAFIYGAVLAFVAAGLFLAVVRRE